MECKQDQALLGGTQYFRASTHESEAHLLWSRHHPHRPQDASAWVQALKPGGCGPPQPPGSGDQKPHSSGWPDPLGDLEQAGQKVRCPGSATCGLLQGGGTLSEPWPADLETQSWQLGCLGKRAVEGWAADASGLYGGMQTCPERTVGTRAAVGGLGSGGSGWRGGKRSHPERGLGGGREGRRGGCARAGYYVGPCCLPFSAGPPLRGPSGGGVRAGSRA